MNTAGKSSQTELISWKTVLVDLEEKNFKNPKPIRIGMKKILQQ